jgi:acetyl esterase/lipase
MLNHSLVIASFILLAGTALSGCHTHLNGQPGEPSEQVSYPVDQVLENIIYTSPDWPEPLEADLYLPEKRGLRPVVLMIHGGGWANRSRADMNGISRKLMQQGYAVLNVNYRFAPRFTYPAQLHDLQQALEWVAQNANRYRLDLERVNTWGYSSGAHLAALIGGLDHDDHLPVETASPPRIRSVVAGGIPSDLRKYTDSRIVMRFMGGDNHEMPKRYAEASPAFHVSSDDPPVFLYHGMLDFLVTEDQAVDYYEALRAAGIEAELYLHRWRGHMSMFLFGGDAEDKAISFLNRNNSLMRLTAME